MKKKLLSEVVRKLVHVSGVSIILGYTFLINYFSERVAILVMTAVLLILLEIEQIRLAKETYFSKLLAPFIRKHERNHVTAAVYFVISCIICFAAFDYWVAVLATMMTVFGDMFAAIFGTAFGKTKIYRNKTLVGSLAGLMANMGCVMLIIPEYAFIFFPAAVVATVTEIFTGKLDDNLTVPLFAGFTAQMLAFYFQINFPPVDFTFLGLF